jgi:hypothetical protein
MTVDNAALERVISYHEHAAAQLGTDHRRVRSVGVVRTALQKGASVPEAFDLADDFLKHLDRARSKKPTPQP